MTSTGFSNCWNEALNVMFLGLYLFSPGSMFPIYHLTLTQTLTSVKLCLNLTLNLTYSQPLPFYVFIYDGSWARNWLKGGMVWCEPWGSHFINILKIFCTFQIRNPHVIIKSLDRTIENFNQGTAYHIMHSTVCLGSSLIWCILNYCYTVPD